jgi:RimJ/RimL family protein N-acetyltransferase
MSNEVRVLSPGDESLLFSFLEKHLESSVFLVSNAERGGLVDRGEALQATYAANLVDGAITAVAAHGWNGNLLVQGDLGLEAAAQLATTTTGRGIRGIVGPLGLVQRARASLGLEAKPVARELEDRLFVLELARLRVPALLDDPEVSLRPPTDAELIETVAGWRAAYHEEVLGTERTPELSERALRETRAWRNAGNCWVLVHQGELVALTGFNARTRGIVQVGGVFTPPELRRRGYARAAVAASLLGERERERGATRSTLFTGIENNGAIRAYTTLGYEETGEFGLLLCR